METVASWPRLDPYRAATFNKGIFQWYRCPSCTTGNDWRAVEAGSHAYASKDGSYSGLSWTYDQEAKVVGER